MEILNWAQDAMATLFSAAIAIAVVSIFWYLFWEHVLSRNPLIIDFFDLKKKE